MSERSEDCGKCLGSKVVKDPVLIRTEPCSGCSDPEKTTCVKGDNASVSTDQV